MTETEAKTKWCPIPDIAAKMSGTLKPDEKCIGSACMMFRSNIVVLPHSQTEHCYCGLAGKL